MYNNVDTLTMITKGPTRAVQHDEWSTGELQCCKPASTYRGDEVGDVHDGPDGGDSDDDVVDVGQEIVVINCYFSSQVVAELAVRLREGWRAEMHQMEK